MVTALPLVYHSFWLEMFLIGSTVLCLYSSFDRKAGFFLLKKYDAILSSSCLKVSGGPCGLCLSVLAMWLSYSVLPQGHCACPSSLRMVSHLTPTTASQLAGPYGPIYARQAFCVFSPVNISYVNPCSYWLLIFYKHWSIKHLDIALYSYFKSEVR